MYFSSAETLHTGQSLDISLGLKAIKFIQKDVGLKDVGKV